MKRLTTEEFIDKSILVHGNKYDYSLVSYVNNRTNLRIICPVHGEFWQKAGSHLIGSGCLHCGGKVVKTKESFIRQAIDIHGDRYTYSEVEYKNTEAKVKIFCKEHGEFWQTPHTHLGGAGCRKCANNLVSIVNGKNPIGWTLKNWKNSAEYSKRFESFKVYVIECWNDEERFFKIGRTYQTIGRRFRGKHNIPYKWKLIEKFEGDAETMFNLETELKRENKMFKYTPKLKFDGMQECFSRIDNGK